MIKSIVKIIFLLIVLPFITSCDNSNDNKKIRDKANRQSTTNDIIGIWELLKQSYRPSSEPSLVQPNDKEYLEIKSDGICHDGRYPAKWFLSYTDDFIFDSTSKVIFSELTNLEPNSYKEYDRQIKSYQIKVSTENGIKYLHLTSLQTSATKIYIRKN